MGEIGSSRPSRGRRAHQVRTISSGCHCSRASRPRARSWAMSRAATMWFATGHRSPVVWEWPTRRRHASRTGATATVQARDEGLADLVVRPPTPRHAAVQLGPLSRVQPPHAHDDRYGPGAPKPPESTPQSPTSAPPRRCCGVPAPACAAPHSFAGMVEVVDLGSWQILTFPLGL